MVSCGPCYCSPGTPSCTQEGGHLHQGKPGKHSTVDVETEAATMRATLVKEFGDGANMGNEVGDDVLSKYPSIAKKQVSPPFPVIPDGHGKVLICKVQHLGNGHR